MNGGFVGSISHYDDKVNIHAKSFSDTVEKILKVNPAVELTLRIFSVMTDNR